MREVIFGLLRKAGAGKADGKQVLDLEEPFGSEHDVLDITCQSLTPSPAFLPPLVCRSSAGRSQSALHSSGAEAPVRPRPTTRRREFHRT
jgi:hypothetical protein